VKSGTLNLGGTVFDHSQRDGVLYM
jgi:hypothetical protein